MRDNGRPELNFFTDTSFKHFQDCLDAEMKRLTAMGIGSSVKEAQAFSEDEENKLWNLRLLGDSSPRVLLDTMVFLIGKNFSLRSMTLLMTLFADDIIVVNLGGNFTSRRI